MAAHPEGVSAPDIAKCLVEDVPRRTLQYRLKQIVGTCQLNMQGSGRWAKYHLATTEVPIATASAEEVADYSRLITLSEKAKAIRDYVGQAVEARKPVGYNWSFLEQYESNKTFYLEEKDREHLSSTLYIKQGSKARIARAKICEMDFCYTLGMTGSVTK